MMRNIAIGLAAATIATIAIGGSTLSYGQESGISKGTTSGSIKGHRFAELTPMQREHLRGMVREHFAELTPMQRERIRAFVRERFAELTPMQREHLRGMVRERFAELTPMQRERIITFVYRHGPYGRR
jgi:hypothetical protein